MSLAVGDKAPDFTLPADGGGEVSLKALKGQDGRALFLS
jgi:thioredoxin-dependent peroxiredoxin